MKLRKQKLKLKRFVGDIENDYPAEDDLCDLLDLNSGKYCFKHCNLCVLDIEWIRYFIILKRKIKGK